MATTRKPTIGSISSGTLRTEDLIDAFEWELEAMGVELPRCDDDLDEYLADLFTALEECALPYMYFGAHWGDGADFGFWPDFDGIREDSDYCPDAETVPEDYSGLAHEVNDHGNLTVFTYQDGEREILWDCV